MKIELKEISVRELVKGYEDGGEDGVLGYGGKLDIRPQFQREFVYKDEQRNAVIDTVAGNLPLGVMYWAVRNDGRFEVIDGQQRTISICQYVDSSFVFKKRYFYNMQDDEQEQVLNYKVMVYFCSGTDSEKLAWFKTINIAGEEHTAQELRNAVYAGPWTAAAREYFSKNSCRAHDIGNKYLNGTAIRQDYLETAIKWISDGDIEGYMAKHQHDADAKELEKYFESVVAWVKDAFIEYRREMKGVAWGELYNTFKDQDLDPWKLETAVVKYMDDDEVTNKKGIYYYVLNGKEKHLNIRAFSNDQKDKAYRRQDKKCCVCGKKFKIEEMEADHITPWHQGGKTTTENCQMLCKEDNRRKSGK